MKEGGTGGGKTITGLHFEQKVDFQTLLKKIEGYKVISKPNEVGEFVYYDNQLVARCFKKHAFYKY